MYHPSTIVDRARDLRRSLPYNGKVGRVSRASICECICVDLFCFATTVSMLTSCDRSPWSISTSLLLSADPHQSFLRECLPTRGSRRRAKRWRKGYKQLVAQGSRPRLVASCSGFFNATDPSSRVFFLSNLPCMNVRGRVTIARRQHCLHDESPSIHLDAKMCVCARPPSEMSYFMRLAHKF